MEIPGSLDWLKSLIVITVLTMCLVSAERFSLKVSVKLPGAVSSGDHGTDIALQPLTTTQHSPTSPGREKIRACVPRTLVCKTKSNSSWFTIHSSRSMILWYTLYYVWPSLWSFYICFYSWFCHHTGVMQLVQISSKIWITLTLSSACFSLVLEIINIFDSVHQESRGWWS